MRSCLPLRPTVLLGQAAQTRGIDPVLHSPHEQVPQLPAKSRRRQRRIEVPGPRRARCRTLGMSLQKIPDDGVLFGASEQARHRLASGARAVP